MALALEVTEGFFVKDDAGEISNPKTAGCVVLQTTTINGRTAGHIYVYMGAVSGWVDINDHTHA